MKCRGRKTWGERWKDDMKLLGLDSGFTFRFSVRSTFPFSKNSYPKKWIPLAKKYPAMPPLSSEFCEHKISIENLEKSQKFE